MRSKKPKFIDYLDHLWNMLVGFGSAFGIILALKTIDVHMFGLVVMVGSGLFLAFYGVTRGLWRMIV